MPAAPGHTFSDPSIATPSDAALGAVSVITAGIVFVSGLRQASVGCWPMSVCFIMWFHLPPARLWYWLVRVVCVA